MSLTARQRTALGMIQRAENGISGASIADAMGLQACWVTEIMRQLRKLGLAAPTSHGRGALWATPERIPELRTVTHRAPDQPKTGAMLTRSNLRCFCEEEGECWLWTGALSVTGYPLVSVNGRQRLAKRVVAEMFGEPIPRGVVIASAIDEDKCDVRCVRPQHLQRWDRSKLISIAMRDRPNDYARCLRTRLQSPTKLDLAKAREIRASPASTAELAERFGCSRSTVVQVRSGRIWREAAQNASVFHQRA